MLLQKYIKTLRTSKLVVDFVKKDGSIRSMVCTLRDDLVPQLNTSRGNKDKRTDQVTVWDLEINDWRCFKLDSVIKVVRVDKTKLTDITKDFIYD